MKTDKQLRLLTRGNAKELSKFKKEIKLKPLSLEGVKTENKTLKETPPYVHSPKREKFIENLITTEELATILRVTSQTIRNWVARGKIPHIQVGRRNLFQKGSIQKWLNQKEEPLWE